MPKSSLSNMQRMQCLTEDCLVREDHVNKNTLVSNLKFDCLNETQCYHVLEYCNQSGYNSFYWDKKQL
jgi:hypothetical protein